MPRKSLLKCLTFYFFFLWLIVNSNTEEVVLRKIPRPPSFKDQPPADDMPIGLISSLTYKEIPLHLKCEARGEPSVHYKWEKNGQPFLWEEHPNITQVPGNGTLIFEETSVEDEGYYQCFATNIYGTAVSNKVFLRKAGLEPVPEQKVIHRVIKEGNPVSLPCNGPKGFPKPDVGWVHKYPYGMWFHWTLHNNRYVIDSQGNLHFTSYTRNDVPTDGYWACFTSNGFKMEALTGKVNLSVIEPPTVEPVEAKVSPTEVFVSSDVFVLKGEPIDLVCIFDGNPQPEVVWKRIEGLSTGVIDHNVRLQYRWADLHLQGTYECLVSNGVGKEQSRIINVRVEAKPYWKSVSYNTEKEEGGNVEFHCKANGSPEPKIEWFINGLPLNETEENPRLKFVSPTTLRIENLTNSDTAVFQCNASNIHGYVFKNFYLKVMDSPPFFINASAPFYETVRGGSITIPCEVYGSPEPTVKWFHDGHEAEHERYIDILSNGALHIRNALFSHAGHYQCIASNKYGEVKSSSKNGVVVVREGTRITIQPKDLLVHKGQRLTLSCAAVADPNLDLTLEWRTVFKFYTLTSIVSKAEPKKRQVNYVELPLDTQSIGDEIEWLSTCKARTRLDDVEVRFHTTYYIPQDSPRVLSVECNRFIARIRWEPRIAYLSWDIRTGHYRPPILTYRIQYSTSFTPEIWKDALTLIPMNVTEVEIQMSPWTNYSFRISSQNRAGESSFFNIMRYYDMCETPTDVPYNNPENVVGKVTGSNTLIISWNPMPLIEHNAPGLFYRIYYRRFGVDDEWMPSIDIDDWETSQYEVTNVDSTTAYVIKVEAHNSKGISNQSAVEVVGIYFDEEKAKPSFNWELWYKKDGMSGVRVSFLPSLDGNPNGTFYVQYKKNDTTNWLKTEMQTKDNVIEIKDLEPGVAYEFAVVAAEGIHEVQSDIEAIQTVSNGCVNPDRHSKIGQK